MFAWEIIWCSCCFCCCYYWTRLDLSTCMLIYVMFASIWWDLFRYIFLRSYSPLWRCLPVCLSVWLSSSPFSSVENVVARSSPLFVLLSLVSRRAVIIVIREICKFDDRLGSACSMQTYYRLSVCMARAGGRWSLDAFRLVPGRR